MVCLNNNNAFINWLIKWTLNMAKKRPVKYVVHLHSTYRYILLETVKCFSSMKQGSWKDIGMAMYNC